MTDEKCTCGYIPADTQGIIHGGDNIIRTDKSITEYTRPFASDDDVIMSLGITVRELKNNIKDMRCNAKSQYQKRNARPSDCR